MRQQCFEIIQCGQIDLWYLGRVKMKACSAIEHPRWHRQTLSFPVCRRTAPEHGHIAALDDFVNMHLAAKPGMPGIKNFPYLGPMGVVLLRCTTPADLIPALTGKHPIRPTSPRFRRSRQPEPGRRSTYPPKNLFRQAEPPHPSGQQERQRRNRKTRFSQHSPYCMRRLLAR